MSSAESDSNSTLDCPRCGARRTVICDFTPKGDGQVRFVCPKGCDGNAKLT